MWLPEQVGDYGLTKEVPCGSDGRDPRRPLHKRANAVVNPPGPAAAACGTSRKYLCREAVPAAHRPYIKVIRDLTHKSCGLEKRNLWVYAQIDVTIGRNTKRAAGAGGGDPATCQVTYASDPKSKREKKGTEMCHDRGEKHLAFQTLALGCLAIQGQEAAGRWACALDSEPAGHGTSQRHRGMHTSEVCAQLPDSSHRAARSERLKATSKKSFGTFAFHEARGHFTRTQ